MKKLCALLIAFLLAGSLAWCQPAIAATEVSTVSSLMQVIKEEKQKAVYNINLNAPFNKDNCGVKESVSTETGEVIITNNVFDIPGRNGMDLSLNLEYRSRDAKSFNEGTRSNGGVSYGQIIIAWYDVFDANGYWLKTAGLQYAVSEVILAQYTPLGSTDKWLFNGTLQYLNGTTYFTTADIINTTVQKGLESEAKYAFGEGWSVDMPSLDVEGDSVYVSLPNGQTYTADFTSGTGLAKYELTDIVFTKDTSYGNGADTSAYKLYYASGDAYYFSAKGELLVEMDRFRNAIRYYWSDVNGKRLLTKIVDSVGRAVDIQYNDTVTIFKSGGKSVRLVKTPIPGATGRYYLSSFIDTKGREFKYKYTFQEAAFDQVAKAAVNNLYANLIEISYPTGAKTQYVFQKTTKNLGTSGYMEYFRAKERKDISGDKTYNRLTYQFHNEPDGYPVYKAGAIDELYKYYTTVTDSKGLTTKYMFNSKHLPYLTQQYSTRLLSETYTQYHPKYSMPIKTTSKTYNAKGIAFEKVDTYEYDHRGNTIAENHPDTPGEVNSVEHKTFYTYNFEYNLLTSKKFKQDKDTTIEVKYDLTLNKKNVQAENIYGNGKLLDSSEFDYDEYGNLESDKTQQKPGEWVTTEYRYGPEYKGAYLTEVIRAGVKDADGFTKGIRACFTYDFATGNQMTSTDGNGNVTTYEYDLLDRVTKEIEPNGCFETFSFDDINNIVEHTDRNKNQLVYYYDSLGNMTKVIEPVNNTVLAEMEYNEQEEVVLEKDGNRNLKRFNYDELTRLTGIVWAEPSAKVLAEKVVTYDEAFKDKFSNPFLKITVTEKGDKQDRIENYYFDAQDMLIKKGRIFNNKEEFAYYKFDYLDKVVEEKEFGGETSLFKYDALGRLIKETDALGNNTKYEYDLLGNLIAQTDALGKTTYFEYDSLGRKIIDREPYEKDKYSISKYYYDNADNLVKSVDPEGFVMKQHFNNRNFRTAIEKVHNSKSSNITKFEYDKEGNVTKVIEGLNNWNDPEYSAYSYKYDSLDRLELMADVSDRKTRYEYDGNGNLVKLIDRNNVSITYKYDGLDRVVQKLNSKDGNKNRITITFDKLGNTRKMVDPSGTTEFDYDILGHLTKVNYTNGIRQNYTYDNADRLTGMKVAQGSINHINLKYEYDKVGRLTKVNDTGKNYGYKYNKIGKLVEENNGVTGIKSEYNYYPSGNIKSLRHFDGKNLISSYEYRYDMRDNQTEKVDGEGTTKYFYDPQSRIKTVLQPDTGVENYEYDDLDNIKELTEIKGTKIETTNYMYDRDSRLLLQETDKGSETIQRRFTYDDNGNQLTKDEVIKRNGSTVASKSFQFGYDGFNQLRRVKDPDSRFTEYTYNGQGLRTKKDFGDRSTNYYYQKENIILETDQNNKVTATNIRGLRLISRATESSLYYYLHNAHGDVAQLLNDKGQAVKDYRYDTFGKEDFASPQAFGGKRTQEIWHQEIEKIDNPFRYSGEYLDEETGNYYLRARYYDPEIQRFINEDSYGVERGAAWLEHLYNYCGNDPINNVDPSGHIYDLVDIGMASWSWGEFATKPSWGNFGYAVLDTVGCLPGVPSPGYITRPLRMAKKADKVVEGIKTVKKGEKAAGAGKAIVNGKKKADKLDVNLQLFGGKKKAETLARNRANGAAFEQSTKKAISRTQKNVKEQITIKTTNGVKTKVDFIGNSKKTSKIKITESKSSSTAPLTKKQKVGFPEIAKSGGVVVGKGKAPFVGGTKIPPTKVDVKRPKK
jgi:RHS repeat-associated protein